jgi:hypothetical protein
MAWTTTSLHRLAGALMLILVVGLILGFLFAQTPDSSRDEIASDLEDLEEDSELYLFGQGVQIVVGLIVPLMGAALFTLLRDCDRFLALVGFSGFFALGILFLASAASYIVVERLAYDLVHGGAGGLEKQRSWNSLARRRLCHLREPHSSGALCRSDSR